jgi:PilZ domain-containing protein
MKQNERSIVRKKTQSLVYLELGRENGAVMLNLSEHGCGFQAISAVKPGKTRFAFQISGGRRVAGEAEVAWVDEAGIMGGMHFLDLQPEARRQVRMWLNDTNAQEELGEGVAPAPTAPVDALRQGWLSAQNWEASAAAASPRDRQRNSPSGSAVGVTEEPALPPPWATVPPASFPGLEDVRARFPLMRGDDSYGSSRARSAALWKSLAMLATVVAAGALLYVYQRDVGDSLIWLGETLSARTKVSAVVPENKPAEAVPVPAEANGAAEKSEAEAAPQTESDAAPKTESDVTPKKETELARAKEPAPMQSDAVIRSTERSQSMLEQQSVRQKVDLPRSEGESVSSLWDAVQGGSISAEMSLAERFARGDGVAKNCDQARILLKAAAGKGNREARLRLYQLESGGCR